MFMAGTGDCSPGSTCAERELGTHPGSNPPPLSGSNGRRRPLLPPRNVEEHPIFTRKGDEIKFRGREEWASVNLASSQPRIDTVDLRDAADRYLESCFARETPPHVREFAATVDLAFNYLSHIFRVKVGINASTYLKNAQVERAKLLLVSTTHPIAAVASHCGYGTPQTFHRAFRRRTGTTPTAFRALAGEPQPHEET
jgi:AraC-like DNA-binding protein